MKFKKTFFILLLVFGCASYEHPKIKEVSGFEYQSQQKKHFNLTHSQSPYVIVFLSSQCPCSQSHLQHIEKLRRQHPEVTFVGIHSNKDEADKQAQSFLGSLTFPTIRDKDYKLANKFRALTTPQSYLFSSRGELLYHGAVSNRSNFDQSTKFYLNDALHAVAHNQKIKISKTTPLGCPISRE